MTMPVELKPFVLSDVRPTGRELGRGAYGSVKEVEIPGALCAAKRIHDDLLHFGSKEGFDHVTKKFEEECKLMSTLRHPHIVQFLGIFYLPGSHLPSLVMERMEMCLQTVLETNEDLPLQVKQSVLLDIAKGLSYLHIQSPPIIHRDLTTRNILLNSSMVAKIADLGVARIVDLKPGQLEAAMTRLPGNVVYMPPEAFHKDAKYGASLDIFSFGNIVLFTLTQWDPKDLLPASNTDSKGKVTGLSEVERRFDGFKILKCQFEQYVTLTEDCLHNLASKRPSARSLAERLSKIPVDTSGDNFRGCNILELTKELFSKEGRIVELSVQTSIDEERNRQLSEKLSLMESEKDHLQRRLDRINFDELLDRMSAIEERLDKAQIQGIISSEEMDQLHSQLDSMKLQVNIKDELHFPLSFKWQQEPSMLHGVQFGDAIVLGSQVYCRSEDAVHQYNSDSGTWAVLPDIPVKLFTIAQLNGQLLAVGGLDGSTKALSKTIYVWDSSEEQWCPSLYPSMPSGLSRPGCANYKHYLILAGGFASRVFSSAVAILDTQKKKWYTGPCFPSNTEGGIARTIVIGERVYMLIHQRGTLTPTKFILHASLSTLILYGESGRTRDSSVWEMLSRDVLHYVTMIFSIGGMLLTVGEWPRGVTTSVAVLEPISMKLPTTKVSADIHLYNPDPHATRWVKVGELPEVMYNCACTMLPSGKLFVAGGLSGVKGRQKLVNSVYTAKIRR